MPEGTAHFLTCWTGSSAMAPTLSSSWANGQAQQTWRREAPWAYHYAGRPDRTAEVVHAIVNNMFGLGPGGLPGNDDSGGLSSWYVWASLGLFPVAGQSVYLINAPSFAESRIALADEELLIDTSGFVEPVASGPTQYVQSAIFNGETLDRTWLTARELHCGGHLRLRLGSQPSAWGTTTRPPSASNVSTQTVSRPGIS